MSDWSTNRIEVAVFVLLMLAVLARAAFRFMRWVDRGRHWESGPSLARRLRCLLGSHKRSHRERYRDDDGVARSLCRGCRRRMEKDGDGRWRLSA